MADMSSVRQYCRNNGLEHDVAGFKWCVPIYKSGVQQMVLLVVGVMIGFVLGLRFFNVFVLFPAFGLAVLGTAAVGIGRGERLGSVILTTVFVGSAFKSVIWSGLSLVLYGPHATCSMRMWVVSRI
jgi:hypothetical protein